MDLLQSVRKEGSRGGVNFSWDDVKSSQHRENYLGHSLKAPVGRWQKNKDLGWYAKGDDADLTPEQRLEKDREMKREEMRKVKEAEEDAMARALGLPVKERGIANANEEPLGVGKVGMGEVNQALREVLGDGEGREDGGDVVGKETEIAVEVEGPGKGAEAQAPASRPLTLKGKEIVQITKQRPAAGRGQAQETNRLCRAAEKQRQKTPAQPDSVEVAAPEETA